MITIKYLLCILILVAIFLAPAWLARQNGKDKFNNLFVRIANFIFGWTIIGWFVALFLAARKKSF